MERSTVTVVTSRGKFEQLTSRGETLVKMLVLTLARIIDVLWNPRDVDGKED